MSAFFIKEIKVSAKTLLAALFKGAPLFTKLKVVLNFAGSMSPNCLIKGIKVVFDSKPDFSSSFNTLFISSLISFFHFFIIFFNYFCCEIATRF
jgi:hypothetical protein